MEDIVEIWKDVKDFEGLYQVSNLGKIRSSKKIIVGVIHKCGYRRVLLYKPNTKRWCVSVHRLVALSFCDNTSNKRCVNHLNGDKTDNRSINLEWSTHSENTQHAIKTGLLVHYLNNSSSIPIGQYSLLGDLIKIWPSAAEASRNGFGLPNIRKCANKVYGCVTHKGFIWKNYEQQV